LASSVRSSQCLGGRPALTGNFPLAASSHTGIRHNSSPAYSSTHPPGQWLFVWIFKSRVSLKDTRSHAFSSAVVKRQRKLSPESFERLVLRALYWSGPVTGLRDGLAVRPLLGRALGTPSEIWRTAPEIPSHSADVKRHVNLKVLTNSGNFCNNL
jgi:hypothetical protein